MIIYLRPGSSITAIYLGWDQGHQYLWLIEKWGVNGTTTSECHWISMEILGLDKKLYDAPPLIFDIYTV